MRKVLLLSVSFLFYFASGAQSDSLKWVKEINEQVWKPFITHFISGNQEGFQSVHSKRITRVEIDRAVVLDFEEYFPSADLQVPLVKRNSNRLFELRIACLKYFHV